MKKLLLLLFSILISFNSYGGLFDKTICVETDSQLRDGLIYLPNKTKPFSGKNLCKYENGQNKSKGQIEDGKKDDIWTEWEENGQIKLERTYNFEQIVREKNYQNGIEMNDISFSYNEKGQKLKEEYFKDGSQINSRIYGWYNNGQLDFEKNYKEGKKDGKFTYWFPNGYIDTEMYYGDNKIKKKSIFKLGIRTKEYLYDENSQILEELNYKDDNLVGETYYKYYKNGQKKGVFNSKDGKPEGQVTTWYENGQLKVQGNNREGKVDGIYIRWYENGQIRSESNWKDGECISGDCPD